MELALSAAATTPDHWATRLVCSRTGAVLPLDRPAFLSAAGAPLLVEYDLDPARGVQLASAGNAALALAAYAAAAGLPARLAMPEDTPASIFARCREHGAEVLASPGTLVDAAKLLPPPETDGFWNLSTLREPYR